MGYINLGVLGRSFYSAFGDGKKRYLERRRDRKKNKKNLKVDETIREEVYETLKWNPDVDVTDIGIVVNNGVVSLFGSVDSIHARKIAEEVTEETPGVIDIENHLVIKPGLDIDSDKIVARGEDGLFTQESNPR